MKVRKKTKEKFKKNEAKRREIKLGKYFRRRKHHTQFYLQKFEKNSKKLFGPKGRKK